MCRPSRCSSSGLKSPSDPLDARPILLISDLHLQASRPAITQLLFDFLRGPARRARALYILGDLFEAWIGDDGADALADSVADEIRALADSGVPVFFIAGNRDFLLGDGYCDLAGMRRLVEPVPLPEAALPTLLMHGDGLCTDDLDYQRFRRRVRGPGWQARMLARPLWLRRLLARLARSLSRRRSRAKPDHWLDVNPGAVADSLRGSQACRLIHGHTHRPGIHPVELGERSGERIVLGDWSDTRGSVLKLDGESAELMALLRDAQGALVFRTLAASTGPG